jgi:hypothetical protein
VQHKLLGPNIFSMFSSRFGGLGSRIRLTFLSGVMPVGPICP